MTLEEYATKTGSALREAYNAKQSTSVAIIFNDAESELDKSKISPAARIKFWALVSEEFRSGHLLVEKQEASELYRLMREIEAQLAAKQTSAK